MDFTNLIVSQVGRKKNSIFYFLSFFLLILNSCVTNTRNGVFVSLKLVESDSCYKYCYAVEITIENKTKTNYYLTNIFRSDYLVILDSLNQDYYSKYSDDEFNYFNKNHVYYDLECNYTDNQSYKRSSIRYEKFIEDAVAKEIERLELYNPDINKIESNWKVGNSKRKYVDVILINSGENHKEMIPINTLYRHSGKYSIAFDYLMKNKEIGLESIKVKFQNIQNTRLSQETDSVYITLFPNPIDSIDGYVWYSKTLISDTLFLDTRKMKLKFNDNDKPKKYDSIENIFLNNMPAPPPPEK